MLFSTVVVVTVGSNLYAAYDLVYEFTPELTAV